jgi:hypothetical protein
MLLDCSVTYLPDFVLLQYRSDYSENSILLISMWNIDCEVYLKNIFKNWKNVTWLYRSVLVKLLIPRGPILFSLMSNVVNVCIGWNRCRCIKKKYLTTKRILLDWFVMHLPNFLLLQNRSDYSEGSILIMSMWNIWRRYLRGPKKATWFFCNATARRCAPIVPISVQLSSNAVNVYEK